MPYRLDQNRNGRGIMIFIRDDIPSRVLTKHVFPDNIEGLFIELENLVKDKTCFKNENDPSTIYLF